MCYIKQNYPYPITVEEIANACKLNRSYFSKLFKEIIGSTPQEFLINLRLSEAAEQMKTTSASIGDIAVRCGYPNQLHFSQAFKKRYGICRAALIPVHQRRVHYFHAPLTPADTAASGPGPPGTGG